MAIGRHWSLRSMEAASLLVGLVVHVLLLWSCWPRLGRVNHVSCAYHATRLARISSVSLASRLGRMAHLSCMKCATRCMLLVVPLRLQAVREDHLRKTSSEQSTDGLIVSTSSFKHVEHHSRVFRLTSVCKVRWGHASACLHQGPCFSMF